MSLTDDEVLISVNDSCLKNSLRLGAIGLTGGKLSLLFGFFRLVSSVENFTRR